MNDFKTYYHSKFQNDLYKFFSTIPDESKFHEDTINHQIYSIQYEKLTPASNHLNFLSKEEKEYFGVALFFTILVDMVCFSHYRPFYGRFQNLTKYPKFIGSCPGGCRYHFHPMDLFRAMNKGRSSTGPYLVFYDKFLGAIEVMKEETISFFNEYLPEIDGIEFWGKCQAEFPYKPKN